MVWGRRLRIQAIPVWPWYLPETPSFYSAVNYNICILHTFEYALVALGQKVKIICLIAELGQR